MSTDDRKLHSKTFSSISPALRIGQLSNSTPERRPTNGDRPRDFCPKKLSRAVRSPAGPATLHLEQTQRKSIGRETAQGGESARHSRTNRPTLYFPVCDDHAGFRRLEIDDRFG